LAVIRGNPVAIAQEQTIKEEKVKRGFLVLLVTLVALGALVVAGCAPDAAPPAGEEEEEAPAAPEGEVIKWQFQGHPPVSDYYFTAVQGIADHITAMSGGRLEVEAFAGGSIVPATEELDGVHQGILNMGSA